jgi:hypothetical protein
MEDELARALVLWLDLNQVIRRALNGRYARLPEGGSDARAGSFDHCGRSNPRR